MAKKLCCMVNPGENKNKLCNDCLVRTRKSYALFKSVAPKIKTVADAIRAINDIVDCKYGWGSEHNANCADESAELIIQDLKLDQMKLEAK